MGLGRRRVGGRAADHAGSDPRPERDLPPPNVPLLGLLVGALAGLLIAFVATSNPWLVALDATLAAGAGTAIGAALQRSRERV